MTEYHVQHWSNTEEKWITYATLGNYGNAKEEFDASDKAARLVEVKPLAISTNKNKKIEMSTTPKEDGWYWFKPDHFDTRTINTILSETKHRWLIEGIRVGGNREYGMVQVIKGKVDFPSIMFEVEEMQGWWSERIKSPEEN